MRPSRVYDLGNTPNDKSVKELPGKRQPKETWVMLISSTTLPGTSVLKDSMSLIPEGLSYLWLSDSERSFMEYEKSVINS